MNEIENFNEKCPDNTICQKCKAYSYDDKVGANNFPGSATEIGRCRHYGHTYALWYGRNNSKHPSKTTK